ncbi:hypothetical protein N7481_010189 [Penicillium waksmanii]|uniref:uncharacterized protein n=1 Tax=Penicillium waksmanii TaxID=69791 RepID=UPI0025491717|nr:uncharacterized protein N7481_010189 [Penicillium waksmanii]KAJ5976482.1 hypothetical protein N7481_010189 [Penicillium waksmanii]
MDAPTFCRDLEGDGNTEFNAISAQTERLDSESTAEKAPPLPASLPQTDEEQPLATGPFQPILQLLAELEQDNPELAFQATRVLGPYRRLWESYISKRIGSERLEQTNQELRKENKRLENEKGLLLAHHDEHLSQFYLLNQALEVSRERLISILNDWEQCSQSQVGGLMNCEREQ